MRVLMISWEYPPGVVGGLGRHVHALAVELAAAGHDVVVLSRRPSGTDAETHPTLDDVREGVRVIAVAEDPAHLEFERDLVREKVFVGDLTLTITRPDRSDKLLDHPEVHEAFRKDEYMPYWTGLWPAARMLAKVILREPWPVGLEALELGCGTGINAVWLATQGFDVTAVDLAPLVPAYRADIWRAGRIDFFTRQQV